MVWLEIAIFVGVAVLSYLLSPRPKDDQSYSEFSATLADEGDPIPVLFGTKKINANKVVWYGDVSIRRK